MCARAHAGVPESGAPARALSLSLYPNSPPPPTSPPSPHPPAAGCGGDIPPVAPGTRSGRDAWRWRHWPTQKTPPPPPPAPPPPLASPPPHWPGYISQPFPPTRKLSLQTSYICIKEDININNIYNKLIFQFYYIYK